MLTTSPTQLFLTEREIEVARSFLKLDSFKEVASELNISVNTVVFHANNLRHKLNERRTHRAVFRAKKMGLLD